MKYNLVNSCIVLSWIFFVCHSSVINGGDGKTSNFTTATLDQIRKEEEVFLRKLGITKPKHPHVGHATPPITTYVRNRFQEMKGNDEIFQRTKDQSVTDDLTMSPTIRLLSPKRIHGHGELVFEVKDRQNFGNISRVELVFNKPRNNNLHVIIVTETEGITSASTDDGYIADVTKIFLEQKQLQGNIIHFKVRLLPQRPHRKLGHAIWRLSPMLSIFDRVPPEVIQHNHRERHRRSQELVERVLTERNNATYETAEDHDYCRIVAWELRFSDLEWERLVQEPPSYTANYCTGICPPPLFESYLNTTNYAFIKNIYHINKDYKDEVVSRACCTPIEYADESMMYFDENERLQIKRLSNMRVTRCGCR